jgi:transposase
MQYSSKVVDHLGLIAGMVDELGIVEVIDAAIPQDLDKRHLSIGQVVKAMNINALGFTGRPLYLTPQFFATKPVELLMGEEINASQINDNTIGRALDRLYRFGVSNLFEHISAKAFEVLQLQSAFAHLDSTSFKVYGNDYSPNSKFVSINEAKEEERPSYIKVTQGFSKDHRPDLAQVMLNMMVENSAGIPMTIEALSGNSSDKVTFAQSVAEYTQMIQTHTDHACIIADSALYTQENLGILASSQLHWVTRVPETINEAQETIKCSYGSDAWIVHDDTRYRYYTYTSHYGGIEQNWVLVYSNEARKRAAKTLHRRYDKLSCKELRNMMTLEKERFACEADAVKALTKLEKSLKLTQMRSHIEPIAHYGKKGRPAKEAQPKRYDYRIVCTPLGSSLEV